MLLQSIKYAYKLCWYRLYHNIAWKSSTVDWNKPGFQRDSLQVKVQSRDYYKAIIKPHYEVVLLVCLLFRHETAEWPRDGVWGSPAERVIRTLWWWYSLLELWPRGRHGLGLHSHRSSWLTSCDNTSSWKLLRCVIDFNSIWVEFRIFLNLKVFS